MSRLRAIVRDKFSRDLTWNIASLGIAGVFGVAINFLIGIAYGAGALGVFNQVFAAFLVCAQLSALGVHISVLTYGAGEETLAGQRAIATAGFALTLVQALVMAVVFAALAGPTARLLASPDVGTGMPLAAPGLVCFALNKVALGVLNARRRMRWYAVLQAGRIVVMGLVFGVFVLVEAPGSMLPAMLSISEGVVLVLALFAIRDQLGRTSRAELVRWAGQHWRFGIRGFLSGLFSEINARVDVFILGAFATDRVVGAYSLAALLAEGLYQLLIALRSNYAPIIVRLFVKGDHDELLRVIRKGRNLTYLVSVALAAVAVVGYMAFIPLVTADPLLQESWRYFAILLAGMVVSAGYAPFNQLLLWAARPGVHTILIASIVVPGAALNAALAPPLGATGAAIATAATYAWSVLALKLTVGRVLRLRI